MEPGINTGLAIVDRDSISTNDTSGTANTQDAGPRGHHKSASVYNQMQVLRKHLRHMSAKKMKTEKDKGALLKIRESHSNLFQTKSKSGISLPKIGTGKLEDSTIIKTQSPLDQELAIQNSRVLNVIDKALQKMEVIMYLPTLLKKNGCILRKFFPREEVEFIMYASSPYTDLIEDRNFDYGKIALIENKIVNIQANFNAVSVRSSTVMDQSSVMIQDKGRSVSNTKDCSALVFGGGMNRMTNEKIDPLMSHVVDILYNNKKLRECISQEKIILRDEMSLLFLRSWKMMRDISLRRLSISAKEETARENALRKLYRSNKECLTKIEQTRIALMKQKAQLQGELQSRQAVIDKYNEAIEKMQIKFQEDLKKRISLSEKSMAEDTVASEAKQLELEAELNTLKEQLEQMLSDNLASEKDLRKKKYKVESQLASWLSKYDNDVGERQAEYDEISQLYEEELREMTDLQEKFDAQEEEYSALMVEKEQEEQELLEEMVQDFLRLHSVRVLQRAWRAYKARKLARKLARKNKRKGAKGIHAGAVKAVAFSPAPPVVVPPPPPVESKPETVEQEEDGSPKTNEDNPED